MVGSEGGGIAVLNETSKDTEDDKSEDTWESELEESVVKRRKPRGGGNILAGWRGVAIGLGLGVALTAGVGAIRSRPPSTPKASTTQPAPPSQTVTIAPAKTTNIARRLETTGTVAARELIPVLPQSTGLQVQRVLLEEGQLVEAGQVMAVLDNSVLQAQLDQAKADVESNRAVVQQRQAALGQARATLAEAQTNLQRYQQLAQAGAIARQELETRATAAATAREAVRLQQANISSAQADVRSSEARVQQLQTQLGQTIVRAPASGIVAEKIARIGDVANPSQKLFSIIRNGQIELQAKVPAIQLPQVEISAPVLVTSDTDNRVRLQGQVREIAPLVNEQSRQATVRIDLPPTSLLRPGMFARAAITTTTTTGVTVPAKAVLPQPDGSAVVFLLTGEDTVQAQKVEVGEVESGGNVEIQSGLKPGDRVVVAGAGYLKDGDRVRIANSN
nr:MULTISPECIES: efflux RND transporter periplasmic adaptor subunit [unclassified Trichocoleus]